MHPIAAVPVIAGLAKFFGSKRSKSSNNENKEESKGRSRGRGRRRGRRFGLSSSRPKEQPSTPQGESFFPRRTSDQSPIMLSKDQTRGYVRGDWWESFGRSECQALIESNDSLTPEEIALTLAQTHLTDVDWEADEVPQGVSTVLMRLRRNVDSYMNESLDSAVQEIDAATLVDGVPVDGSHEEETQAILSEDAPEASKTRRGNRGGKRNKKSAAPEESEANDGGSANEQDAANEPEPEPESDGAA